MQVRFRVFKNEHNQHRPNVKEHSKSSELWQSNSGIAIENSAFVALLLRIKIFDSMALIQEAKTLFYLNAFTDGAAYATCLCVFSVICLKWNSYFPLLWMRLVLTISHSRAAGRGVLGNPGVWSTETHGKITQRVRLQSESTPWHILEILFYRY